MDISTNSDELNNEVIIDISDNNSPDRETSENISSEHNLSHKSNSDNNWNSNIELFLTKIGKHALCLKKKHLIAAKNKSKKSNIFSIIVMIITSLSSLSSIAISVIISIRSKDNNNVLVSIKEGVVAMLLLLATLIAGIHNIFRYGDISDKHKDVANKLSYLYHDIQSCFTLPRNKRLDAINYMNDKWQVYENIINSAPYIKDNSKYNNILNSSNKKKITTVIKKNNTKLKLDNKKLDNKKLDNKKLDNKKLDNERNQMIQYQLERFIDKDF